MVGNSHFFPGEGPTFGEFWKRRPGGPNFTLNPVKMDAYDVGWMVAHLGTMALWTHKTGRGVSANMFFGQIFFPRPSISTIAPGGFSSHWHTTGSSPSFTGGLIESNLLRNSIRGALRVAVPLSTAVTAMEVGRFASGTKDTESDYYRYTSERIARARDMSSR